LDLLTHRSGLSEYGYFAEEAGIWQKEEQYLTNQMVLDLYIKHKPAPYTPPNKNFSYCNTNYAFLALIIEKITKKDYPTAMKMMIFDPLDMKATYVFEKKHFKTASLSYFNNGKLHPWDFRDLVYGDKNIYSTPRDMMKWDMALYDTSFFSQKIIEEAFKGYSYERKGVKNYGLGWRLYEMPSGKKIVYHNGWWHGNNTVFSRLPQDTTVIIVLGNKFNRSIYQAKKIAGIFNGYGITTDDDE
jgi:CubicO group peptidase (beta-lactamase class C family)